MYLKTINYDKNKNKIKCLFVVNRVNKKLIYSLISITNLNLETILITRQFKIISDLNFES